MNGLTMRSRKKSKDTLKHMKMRMQQPKSMGHREHTPKKEIHSITGLFRETRQTSHKLT